MFQHRPVRATRERASMRDVHNDVAHRKKNRGGSALMKQSARLSALLTKGTVSDIVSFDALAHKKVAAVDVFGSLMVLWVVGKIDRGLVV
eukprot:3073488-Pleurochrysis_carterae.AAC.2